MTCHQSVTTSGATGLLQPTFKTSDHVLGQIAGEEFINIECDRYVRLDKYHEQ